jgi:tRNA uridine 5-carboxymethylaminomethyl modification enzyme
VARCDHDRQLRLLEKRRRVIRDLAATRARFGGRSETLFQILKRPEMTLAGLQKLHGRELLKKMTFGDASYIEACVKYEGYVAIQHREVAKMRRLQKTAIPEDLDFQSVEGLSREVREKLARARPRTLAEAARIPGVTPAAINAVSIHLTLKRGK